MMSRRNKPKPLSNNVKENGSNVHHHVHRRGAAAEILPNHIQPNVIARLMGMDAAIVVPAKPPAAPPQTRHRGRGSSREDSHFGTGADDDTSSRRTACGLHKMRDALVLPGDINKAGTRIRRPPQRQRHPQEEELLRKMRQDLQAEASTSPVDGSCCVVQVQAIAQEKLRREKMARYGFGVDVPRTTNDGNTNKATTATTTTTPQNNGDDDRRGINRGFDDKEKPPTPIVLLKPATAAAAQEESDQGAVVFPRWLPKLLVLERDGDTSRLLKEVKQRLQRQLKVNAAAATAAAGADAEPTAQIARHQATTGAACRLFRSESFRASRSDRRVAASAAADKGSLLTDGDASSSAPPPSESSDSGDINIIGQISFRSDDCLLVKHTQSKMSSSSPRALARSLSAPESSLFGAAAAAGTSSSNTSFSFITGTVSSLMRRSFGGLGLGRRTKTSLRVGAGDPQPQVATTGLATPPRSPVSPSLEEVVGHRSSCSFSDLHCTAYPASQSFAQLSPESEAPPAYDRRDKAYIRELLIAAGLYNHDDDGSLALQVQDNNNKAICDSVFEEVEDMYYYRGDYCGAGYIIDGKVVVGETATDHRMLFDLANEALQILAERSSRTASSSLCQWVLVDSAAGAGSSSRGRELEDDVWQQVQALRKPRVQETQTIDSMVAHQVRKSVWAELLHDHVYVVATKIERAIFDDLLLQDLVQGFPSLFFNPI